MKLSQKEIKKLLKEWNLAWARYDLDQVMALFHDDIFFENWTGAYIKGEVQIGFKYFSHNYLLVSSLLYKCRATLSLSISIDVFVYVSLLIIFPSLK